MTVECLKSSMLRIERYFGKELSTDERTARAEVYAAALKEIPDDVVSAALVKALTVCRYQNQLLVDWCAEIRKIQERPLERRCCGRTENRSKPLLYAHRWPDYG